MQNIGNQDALFWSLLNFPLSDRAHSLSLLLLVRLKFLSAAVSGTNLESGGTPVLLSNGDLHYSIRWKLLCALVANAKDSRGGRPTHIMLAGSSASCPPPCAARSFWGRKGARAARGSCPFPPISRHEHVPTKGVETWQAGKKSAVKGQERSRSAPVLPCGNYTKKVTGAGNALPFPLSLPAPSPAAGRAQTGPAQGRTLRMSSRDCL